jgi:predicted ester cyclase
MSLEENRTIVERFHEELFGKGRIEAADGFLDTSYVNHTRDLHGPNAFKRAFAEMAASWFGLRVTNEDVIAEGDRVVARWMWHGEQRLESEDLVPVHRQATLEWVSIYRIASGKIIEEWVFARQVLAG